MYQKKKIFRSEEYKTFIRSKPCIYCGVEDDIESHHEDDDFYNSGMGLKPPDSQCLPICVKHHIPVRHKMSAKEFYNLCNVDPKVMMVNYLTEFLGEKQCVNSKKKFRKK